MAFWGDLTPATFKLLMILAYEDGGATIARAVTNGLGDFANEKQV